MKKKAIALLLILIMIIQTSGCEKAESEKTKTLRVGVVLYASDDKFINALTSIMKELFQRRESEDLKIVMSVKNGANDQRAENDVVDEMMDAGCDILVVNLVDRTAPSKIINLARENNVPVIFFNREPVKEDLMQWDKMYYVGCDSAQSGEIQGKLAADMIKQDFSKYDKNGDGKIQYVMLEGEAGHQDAILRTDYSVETLKAEGIKLEKISYQFADWSRAQAENKMQQIISKYGDTVELVLANNDEMALGAIEAYEKADISLDRRPLIYGIDGLDDALSAIKKGTLQGTVYNDKEEQARNIVNLAIDLYKGNSLSSYNIQDGKYLMSEYQRVDISNVDDFIN